MNAPEVAVRLNLRRLSRSWRGDCPACGYHAAFSLRTGPADRPLLWCANGCNRHILLAAIAGRLSNFRAPPVQSDAERDAVLKRKQDVALRLWSTCIPGSGTLADIYLTARGLPGLANSDVLRFLGDASHPEGGKLPALVALVKDVAGTPVAVHRTYLRRDGSGKADIDPSKATLGPVWGGAVRLDLTAYELVIGEGIETSASAGRLLGLPSWAAISAGNLARGLVLPAEVRTVVIAADADDPGEQAAQMAALRWQAEGRRVRIARPNQDGADFNDLLRVQLATEASNAR